MQKKTQQEVLLQIYNETLESLVNQKVNLKVYEGLPKEMEIIPQEVVEAMGRAQKTVATRIKEIKEAIETKENQLKIIDEMIQAEEDSKKDSA